MDEPDQQPAGDQRRLARHHALQKGTRRHRRVGGGRIVPGDGVTGQLRQRLAIAAGGEELERADAEMAGGDAGEDRAGQDRLAQHPRAGRDRRQGAGGRDAERRHGLADQIFAQHRAKGGAAVAAARERRTACPLKLDVASPAVPVDHLAEQDGAAIAELGHEAAELVARIRHGDRVGALGRAGARQHGDTVRPLQRIRIQPEFDGKRPVEQQQVRRGRHRRLDTGKKALREARVGVVERDSNGHRRRLGVIGGGGTPTTRHRLGQRLREAKPYPPSCPGSDQDLARTPRLRRTGTRPTL